MDTMISLNEISIIPAKITEIEHRSDVNPYRDGKLPIFVAPMTCIIDDNNFNTFNESKVIPIHPRVTETGINLADEWQAYSLDQFDYLFAQGNAPMTFGLNTCHYRALIDVANGHMKKMYDLVSMAKDHYDNHLEVMIGNIANPDTYLECCAAGVDYVRVGIGGGSACTTSVQTGIHASLVWLLSEIQKFKTGDLWVQVNKNDSVRFDYWLKKYGYKATKIIADGGINTIDKAIKCLALGADYVMMGKLFAQCEEACGETRQPYNLKTIANIEDDRPHYTERKYYGMASEQGQKDISGGIKKAAEGIETWIPIEYTLESFTSKFEASLRSSMSYCNAKTLDDFCGKVQIKQMSPEEFKSYNK